MEPVLGPPLQNILRRRGPFLNLQEFCLALIECTTEMTAEVTARPHAIEQSVNASPIEPRIMNKHLARQVRIVAAKVSCERIEVGQRDITTGQCGASRPRARH